MPIIPMVPGTTIQVNGITCEVLADGASKGIEDGSGPWREVIYQCNYSDSDNLCDSLKGIGGVVGGAGGARIRPLAHAYPNNVNLRCSSVRAIGVGPAGPDPKLITYPTGYAHVTALYKPPTWDSLGQDYLNAFNGQPVPFAEMRIRGYTESIPIPRAALKNAGGDQPAIAMHKKVAMKQYIYVLHYVPYLPETTLDALMGKVNTAAFWGKARGHILFDDYDTDVTKDSDGNTTQRVEMRLTYRIPAEFNEVPKAGGIGWELLDSADASGATLYEYADFSPLLNI
jgi:hypothetical protein